MKLFIALLFISFSVSAFDDTEQAQMLVCGVIAEDLKSAYTISDIDPSLFTDKYAEYAEADGEWDEASKADLSIRANAQILKAYEDFKDLNPVSARRDPVYTMLFGSYDKAFFAWAYFGCDGIYRRLDTGKLY